MLQLSHALAGQADALADLLERQRVFAIEPVAQLQNIGFALIDVFQQGPRA